MNMLKISGILVAGAALAILPAHVASQATGKPGLLGAQIQVKSDGPEITAMLPDRTAAAIGLKVGDILIEAGGKPISPEVLQEYMKQIKEGDQVAFKVKRAGAVLDLTGKAVGPKQGAPVPTPSATTQPPA